MTEMWNYKREERKEAWGEKDQNWNSNEKYFPLFLPSNIQQRVWREKKETKMGKKKKKISTNWDWLRFSFELKKKKKTKEKEIYYEVFLIFQNVKI